MKVEGSRIAAKRVVVIGAGITGLAAAHRLLELARERSLKIDILVLEGGGRAGGVIATERRDGFLLEGGPESFITDKPWGVALCERLGIADKLIGTNDTHRRSFIAWRGRLLPIPEGFQVLAPSRIRSMAASPLFSWHGKLRMGLDLLLPRRRGEDDESLGHFVERRLGREALERLAQPLISGIYGADARELSVLATLPRFRDMEQQHGSLIRALRAARRRPATRGAAYGVSGARYGLFAAFRNGMQTLPDALAVLLPHGSLRLDSPVTNVTRNASSVTGDEPSVTGGTLCGTRYTMHLATGETLDARAVLLALPAHTAGSLLEGVDTKLAGLLKSIRYGSSATVNLAYARSAVPHPLDGFGFVVPAAEGRSILGCTFSSTKYLGRAPDGMALLRVFFGGTSAEMAEREMETAAREDLRFYLGVTAPPLWSVVHRWPKAMPHYQVGHLDRVRSIEERVAALPGLALAGNAYCGIGIPDSIHSGEQAAQRVAEALSVSR